MRVEDKDSRVCGRTGHCSTPPTRPIRSTSTPASTPGGPASRRWFPAARTGAYWGGHDGDPRQGRRLRLDRGATASAWPGRSSSSTSGRGGKTILSGGVQRVPRLFAVVQPRGSSSRRARRGRPPPRRGRNMPTLMPAMSRAPKLAAGYSSSVARRGGSASTPSRAAGDGLARNGGYTTIMLRANNESDAYGWKKFGANPSLDIVYNTKPNPPTSLSAEGKACALAPNEPYVNPFIDGDPNKGKRGPRLAAQAVDLDGGTVKVEFAWQRPRRTRRSGTASTVFKASGSIFTIDVPAAQVGDDIESCATGPAATTASSTACGEPWCDVTVDRVAPTQLADDLVDDVPAVLPARRATRRPEPDPARSAAASGGPAPSRYRPARPTPTSPGTGTTCVQSALRYVAAGAGGVTNLLITPPRTGSIVLYVRPVDRAGNLGPEARYHFFVGAGTPPVANGGSTASPRRRRSTTHRTTTTAPCRWVRRPGRSAGTATRCGSTASSAAFVEHDQRARRAHERLVRGFRVGQAGQRRQQLPDRGQPGRQQASARSTCSTTEDPQVELRDDARSNAADRVRIVGRVAPAGDRRAVDPSARRLRRRDQADADLRRRRARCRARALATSWDGGGDGAVRPGTRRRPVTCATGSARSTRCRIYDRELRRTEIPAWPAVPATEELFLPLDEGSGAP